MKQEVPIDNKNVMEDLIYEMFDSFIETPGMTRSIVGFIGHSLVGASWLFNTNTVVFRLIEGPDVFIKSFAERLLKDTNGDTSYIYTTVHVNGNYINLSFWYDED